MLNQIVLVGKIGAKSLRDGVIIIEIERPFRNDEGGYDVDSLSVDVTSLQHTQEQRTMLSELKNGQLIGIKGYIATAYRAVPTIVVTKVSVLGV